MSAIEDLVTELAKLPGIGRKTAQRLTFYLLKQPAETATRLAEAIRNVRARVRACGECGTLTDEEPCAICRDPRRDASVLCVVEEASDVTAIERAGRFRGRYHVLGGRLAPLDGVGPDRLTFGALVERVRRGGVREVILATSPTLEGDGTALLASNLLAGTGVAITRLARGVPSGASLELVNAQMLADALEGRRAF